MEFIKPYVNKKNLVINKGDVIEGRPEFNQSVVFYKRVEDVELRDNKVFFKGSKLCTEGKDAQVTTEYSTGVVLEDNIFGVNFYGLSTQEFTRTASYNNITYSSGDVIGFTDLSSKEYEFQIRNFADKNGRSIAFGWVGEHKNLKEREGESVSGYIDLVEIEKIIFSTPKQEDKNGKPLEVKNVVKFKNRQGNYLFKKILRIEEENGVMKLWGTAAVTTRKEVKGTEEDGFVLAHLVEKFGK